MNHIKGREGGRGNPRAGVARGKQLWWPTVEQEGPLRKDGHGRELPAKFLLHSMVFWDGVSNSDCDFRGKNHACGVERVPSTALKEGAVQSI